MTPEFEKWVNKCVEGTDSQEPLWSIVHALGTSSAHYWLTRIFAEIKQQEAAICGHTDKHCQECSAIALDNIKAKFGLGGE